MEIYRNGKWLPESYIPSFFGMDSKTENPEISRSCKFIVPWVIPDTNKSEIAHESKVTRTAMNKDMSDKEFKNI